MNKNRSVAVGVVIFSILAIIVIVVSLFNTAAPSAPTPTSTEVVLPTDTPPATPTIINTPDPCAPENLEASIQEFDRLSREFSDAFVLAQNTPAAQLSPTISEMQRIRRDAQDFVTPSCLMTLKEYQIGFMNTAIDAALILYSTFSGDPSKTLTEEQINNVVALVNQRVAEARDFSSKYTIEMARLLGVTVEAPPTLIFPDVTLTPATVTP